jgi:hypothetical protein
MFHRMAVRASIRKRTTRQAAVPEHYHYRRGSFSAFDAGDDLTAEWHPQRAVLTNPAPRFSASLGWCTFFAGCKFSAQGWQRCGGLPGGKGGYLSRGRFNKLLPGLRSFYLSLNVNQLSFPILFRLLPRTGDRV